MRLILWIAAAAFALDRLVKWWVLDVADLERIGRLDVHPPYLRLIMVWNEGANFGLGAGLGRDAWIAVAVVVSAAVLWWARGMATARARVCAGLLVGGALGNALDRALWGAVADFFNMSCCGIANPWAFNPADVFIFVGAVGLALWADAERTAA